MTNQQVHMQHHLAALAGSQKARSAFHKGHDRNLKAVRVSFIVSSANWFGTAG
jgi:hypothetical protein